MQQNQARVEHFQSHYLRHLHSVIISTLTFSLVSFDKSSEQHLLNESLYVVELKASTHCPFAKG